MRPFPRRGRHNGRKIWWAAGDGTDLDGATLLVEPIPAVIVCRSRGSRTRLEHVSLRRPDCDSADVGVASGEELQIASLDVVEEVS